MACRQRPGSAGGVSSRKMPSRPPTGAAYRDEKTLPPVGICLREAPETTGGRVFPYIPYGLPLPSVFSVSVPTLVGCMNRTLPVGD